MAEQRVLVMVEESEIAMEALEWAVRNFLRQGDWITLLHVFPVAGSNQRQRLLRLKGFQLALAFKDLCNRIPEGKVEIVVKEGEEAITVAELVREIRASTLILGLHEDSFLYNFSTANFLRNLDCRILAIKNNATDYEDFVGVEFSQALCSAAEDSLQNSANLLPETIVEEEIQLDLRTLIIFLCPRFTNSEVDEN